MRHTQYILLFIILLFGCKTDKSKRIIRFGEFAEGNISIGKDTVFNGLIRYYDTTTNRLTSKIFYKNDTVNGPSVDFHQNGKIASIANYIMGDEHGVTSFYDSSGNIFQTNYYFHGIHVGPFTMFKEKKPFKYSFYSFDGRRLFQLNYDSISEMEIKNWKDKLFFFTENYAVDDYNPQNVKKIYFLYLPNPPEFEFKYSFCLLDSSDKIIKTVENFDSAKPWTEYIANPNDKEKNQSFAFCLRVIRNGKETFSDIRKVN